MTEEVRDTTKELPLLKGSEPKKKQSGNHKKAHSVEVNGREVLVSYRTLRKGPNR